MISVVSVRNIFSALNLQLFVLCDINNQTFYCLTSFRLEVWWLPRPGFPLSVVMMLTQWWYLAAADPAPERHWQHRWTQHLYTEHRWSLEISSDIRGLLQCWQLSDAIKSDTFPRWVGDVSSFILLVVPIMQFIGYISTNQWLVRIYCLNNKIVR